MRLAATTMSGGVVGEHQLQAAIAALHDGTERAEDTDWPQILALYGLLARLSGHPMVELNRAVAAAMVHGPRAGLDLLAPLEERLPGHYRLDAVRGHLLDMTGGTEAAAAHYRTVGSLAGVLRSLGRGWGRGRRKVLPAGSWLWRMDASSRSRPALEGRSSFQ